MRYNTYKSIIQDLTSLRHNVITDHDVRAYSWKSQITLYTYESPCTDSVQDLKPDFPHPE